MLIVQKYIERPLIIQKKKFDIRLWVVAAGFNPLKAYIYQKFYLRFGADNYSSKNIDNLYAHLTNNSIAKKSSGFYESEIEG